MTAIRTSAVVGNIVWALFLGFGVLVDGTLVAKVGFIFFGVIALRNVFAILSRGIRMDRPTILMNGALMLFAVTTVAIGQYPYDRLGAAGLAIISAFNAMALMVGKDDSWLGLLKKSTQVPAPREELETTPR